MEEPIQQFLVLPLFLLPMNPVLRMLHRVDQVLCLDRLEKVAAGSMGRIWLLNFTGG
ncbi:MAG: hypothetical protein H6573_19210 [Lewinellaceae bacterium]|nr:hypothetical protein [Lewinellaceae bacterium]